MNFPKTVKMHPSKFKAVENWIDSTGDENFHFERRHGKGSLPAAYDLLIVKTNCGRNSEFVVDNKEEYYTISDLVSIADEEGFHAEDYGFPEDDPEWDWELVDNLI